jgi:hypothetical protein
MPRDDDFEWSEGSLAFGPGEDDDMTVGQAKAAARHLFEAGEISDCKCCGQTIKKYPRSINKTMVASLEVMLRLGGATSRQILAATRQSGGGDHAKLAYWGLAAYREDDKAWMCTDKGRKFLAGEIMVAKYAHLYNSDLHGFSKAQVSVAECLGGFNIESLLDPNTGKGDS